MPHVINGVGTWYYGKRNVHRLRDVCAQCGAAGDLEAYDTTLYFVVVFVPLLPLARKRVMDSCPACGAHRVMPLKVWEEAKSEGLTGALDRLLAAPGEREAVLGALGTAATFQNAALLAVAADALATHHPGDAGLLATLGDVNGYFARHDAAAAAYIESLKAEDNPLVSERLGLTLLRLGNPAAAAGCFEHVLSGSDGGKLWMAYQLAVAYQAKGLHPEALAWLDRVTAAYPAVADNKDWRRLRQKSERDRGRGRPVGKSPLLEGSRAGLSEGSWLKWLFPRLILPLLLLALAGGHTWRSLSLAQARPMYLLSGATRPYTVVVNGVPHTLAPGVPKPVVLPEGTLTMAPAPGAAWPEPVEVTVRSSFWARPYDNTRVVLNPDRLAVLVRETTIYAVNPQPGPPDTYLLGQPVYEVSGVSHLFEPVPAQVQAKRHETVTRTRLGVVPVASPDARIDAVTYAAVTPAERLDYGVRWLAADPADPSALAWFARANPPADVAAALKPRLGDRPLRADWHALYQSAVDQLGGDTAGLRVEYAELADRLDRDPDALYLQARLSRRGEALELLTEAVESGRPAERAHAELGHRKLREGDFKAAAAEFDKAPSLARHPLFQAAARDALLAAGRHRDLVAQLALDPRSHFERARIYELAGDPAGADSAAGAFFAQLALPPADFALRKTLQSALTASRAAARGDRAGYLAAAAPDAASVADAVLRGGPVAAPPDATAADHGLALLATPPADARHAAAKSAYLEALESGGPDEKYLKLHLELGTEEIVTTLREAYLEPREKRVHAAAATLWYPARKPQLDALARTYDYHRDATSLALRKLLGDKPPKLGRKAVP